jgi:hypothetical protein
MGPKSSAMATSGRLTKKNDRSVCLDSFLLNYPYSEAAFDFSRS